MEKQSAKKARTAPVKGGPVNEPQQQEEDESAGSYTIEAEALRCDICFKPFGEQIFMCKNGHPACGSCCLIMDRMCFCTEPIGDIRCRALEKVLASMTRPCTYVTYGCHQTVTYTERRRHEEACRYAPYHCPFEGCTYYGLLLYNHIQDLHASGSDDDEAAVVVRCNRRSAVTLEKTMPFRVLLHRDGASMFLLLNGGDVLAGRSLSLVCMGPRPTGNAEVKYKMEVKKRNDPEALVLWSSGAAPFVRRLKDFQARGFLFVPNSYWDSSDSVSVTVHLTDGW
ncbi:E3 ubiquitin-protein ligase SINA-like 5 [Triticum dicoccoides]|uniref:E3 ubiquitin-protein ligase SINA-like 5 n=1 Tax=Triticum dicoccoides TaxID=85692 RepID=UPI001890C91A|nr:E3 ubiquitin-protein ligase SINA-like 5 [Triticum dicoccoides]